MSKLEKKSLPLWDRRHTFYHSCLSARHILFNFGMKLKTAGVRIPVLKMVK